MVTRERVTSQRGSGLEELGEGGSLVPLERSLGGGGGSGRRSTLEVSVSEDTLRELLLGLLEAGACPPVHGVHHFK